ncbi:MAG TPA: XdhC family protein [Methylomirabilota bacterium]|jgi:xanthine dehydrogenase accessory factor|nr:XdhC family protein [Methylomirabilota bacterium]
MSAQILREAWQRLSIGERVALATVVATRGSTPQKVGARILVRGDGGSLGTLGGGAVEAEAVREASLRLGWGKPLIREYALSTGTDEWGLACGGTMVVFVEPLAEDALGWLQLVIGAVASGEPLALLTLLEGAQAGARLVVREDASVGTFGDPALDGEAAAMGRRVLVREGTELASLAGSRVYAETFGPAPALVIVGAGHVGKALAALGRFLDLPVTVLDDRPEYASRERFPEADEVVAEPVGEALGRLPVTPRTAIVVAMRNQDLDHEATAAALRTRAGYVGLIGSRRKAMLIAERLVADGVPAERVRAVRSPIGLDIGAQTPAEIALAILGEWLMLRQGGSGTPLRLDEALFTKAAAKAAGLPAPAGAARSGPDAG